jgi:hypothetical protein
VTEPEMTTSQYSKYQLMLHLCTIEKRLKICPCFIVFYIRRLLNCSYRTVPQLCLNLNKNLEVIHLYEVGALSKSEMGRHEFSSMLSILFNNKDNLLSDVSCDGRPAYSNRAFVTSLYLSIQTYARVGPTLL